MRYVTLDVFLAVLVATCASPTANAASYTLTIDHCTGGCNPGMAGTSMGTVDVSGTGTNHLTVTVTLDSPLKFVGSGLQDTIDFNLLGSPVITSFSTTNSDFSLTSTSAGSRHFDGFGNFEYSLKLSSNGSGSAQASPERFTITCSSTCTETANSGGYFFGIDVYNAVNGNTGPIGSNSDPPPVPEPASIAVFGGGLFICGWVLRGQLRS